MKDFELRYVGNHVEVYTGAMPWKSWPGKRRHIAFGKAECKMYVK